MKPLLSPLNDWLRAHPVPFIAWRWILLGLAAVVVVGALAAMAVRGLNPGIDFTGGVEMEVRLAPGVDADAAAAALAAVRDSGTRYTIRLMAYRDQGSDIIIKLANPAGEAALRDAIPRVRELLAPGTREVRRVDFVGPTFSNELLKASILALTLSLLAVLVYIWFRFQWRFALVSIVALAHDVIVCLGVYALSGFEFNIPSVAAILTIAGYSINDTVVILDRVRETLCKHRRRPLTDVFDAALNETLGRTIMTSLTTLLALLALLSFGGGVIFSFAVVLICGVLAGTFSSVGVAVPLLSLMSVPRGKPGDG